MAPASLQQNILVKCGIFFCMTCSVFEEDEYTPGWKVGRSVGRCEGFFRDLMNESELEFDHKSETNISCSSRSSSGGKSLQSTVNNPKERCVLALQTRLRR